MTRIFASPLRVNSKADIGHIEEHISYSVECGLCFQPIPLYATCSKSALAYAIKQEVVLYETDDEKGVAHTACVDTWADEMGVTRCGVQTTEGVSNAP